MPRLHFDVIAGSSAPKCILPQVKKLHYHAGRKWSNTIGRIALTPAEIAYL